MMADSHKPKEIIWLTVDVYYIHKAANSSHIMLDFYLNFCNSISSFIDYEKNFCYHLVIINKDLF